MFERLALPGFGRARRFDLLTALGAAGLYELEAGELFLGIEDDATTLAAKRLLVSGDRLLLERRARELAEACELPLAALDRGLAVWGTPGRAGRPRRRAARRRPRGAGAAVSVAVAELDLARRRARSSGWSRCSGRATPSRRS